MSNASTVTIMVEEMLCEHGHTFPALGDAINDRQSIVWNGTPGSARLVDRTNISAIEQFVKIVYQHFSRRDAYYLIPALSGLPYDPPDASSPRMHSMTDDQYNPTCPEHPNALTSRNGRELGRETISIPHATTTHWDAMTDQEKADVVRFAAESELQTLKSLNRRRFETFSTFGR